MHTADMLYYVAALFLIVAMNCVAARWASAFVKRLVLVGSAGLPIILGVGFDLWLFHKNGPVATINDPYFLVFWMMALAATLATTAAAFLGRGLLPRNRRPRGR